MVFTDDILKDFKTVFKYLNNWDIHSLEVLQCHNLRESKIIKLRYNLQKIQSTGRFCKDFIESLIENGITVKYNSL